MDSIVHAIRNSPSSQMLIDVYPFAPQANNIYFGMTRRQLSHRVCGDMKYIMRV